VLHEMRPAGFAHIDSRAALMATTSLDAEGVRRMLLAVADRLIASELVLSQADRQLGDGDHGLGMARGFTVVKADLETSGSASIAQLFGRTGMAMLNSMGGASGALFGTMFRLGGKALDGRVAFDSAALADFLASALSGVVARGGAKPGDKTMVDALEPAASGAREAAALPLAEAMCKVAAAAAAGKRATASMIATMGRAKGLGQAAIGFEDPGAISVALILEAMRDFVIRSKTSWNQQNAEEPGGGA
jgi:dihydroxyacetone kinase-like protein